MQMDGAQATMVRQDGQEMSCHTGNCKGCQGCCGGCGNGLSLFREELELLRCFAQSPFLPVACAAGTAEPVYLENGRDKTGKYAAAIALLQRKGLIRVDYDIPLKNFSYDGYEAYPCKGSMALTANGIRVLEVLETQGVTGEEL